MSDRFSPNPPAPVNADFAHPAPLAKSRADALARVMAQVIECRAQGQILPDAQVIASHPELLPEIKAELAALRDIHRAYLAAQKLPNGSGFPESDEGREKRTGEGVGSASADAAVPPIENRKSKIENPLVLHGYEVLEEISAGGQGTVFKALQTATGRTVALKLIPGGPLLSSRQRARFEREVSILAALDHPGIVGILDRGRTADGSLFLVMDYIEGWPLDEFIATARHRDELSLDRLLELFIQIAQAVQDAHARGVVHRDLKPSNIRVDRRGRAHVLDFGLARLLASPLADDSWTHTVTMTGQIVGSLPWASPEQVSGQPEAIGVACDVYALGVMLYQALAGQFPYPVRGPLSEVVSNIQKKTPTPPSHVAAPIPPALDRLLLRALAKSPAQRQPSAGTLAQELEECRRCLPTFRPASRTRSRQRDRLAIALVLAVLATQTLLFCLQSYQPPQASEVVPFPTLTNTLGMRLVQLPAGQFRMGSQPNEHGRAEDEYAHEVRLTRPFFLASTEVTQGQYRALMGQLPCPQSWPGDDLPVHGVLWSEALEFCRRLGEKEGRRYHLPTEAQWEYACRAGTLSPYATLRSEPLEMLGWFDGNSQGRLHPVASKPPNPWGLYDMHGNVAEWCRDAYQPSYPMDPVLDPLVERDTTHRVLRGGSIFTGQGACRSAARHLRNRTMRARDIGFRILLEVDSPLP